MPPTLTRPIAAVCVYAPSLRHVRLEARGYHFLATDTAGVLRWMVEQAMRVGVVFCWGMPLSTLRRDSGGWIVNASLRALSRRRRWAAFEGRAALRVEQEP